MRFQRKGGVTGLLHWKNRSAASGRCGDPEGTLFLPSFRLHFEGLYQSECYGAGRLGPLHSQFLSSLCLLPGLFPRASLSRVLSPSTTDSSQGARWSVAPGAGGFPAKPRRPQGARRGRVDGARGGGPRGDYKEPSWQRFLISSKSKQGHIPKKKIFRSIK